MYYNMYFATSSDTLMYIKDIILCYAFLMLSHIHSRQWRSVLLRFREHGCIFCARAYYAHIARATRITQAYYNIFRC